MISMPWRSAPSWMFDISGSFLSRTSSPSFSSRRWRFTMYGISFTMMELRPFFFSSTSQRARTVSEPRPVS